MTRAARASANGLKWVTLLGLFVVTVDQVTKWLAVNHLQNQPPIEVLGSWLQLTFVRNPGAAFSIGTQYTWVFALAASAVAIGIVLFSRRVTSTLWLGAMGMLLGGAVGNLIDRFAQPPGAGQGHVVDWLELPNWPVFNVADMAVVGGAIFMVALSLFGVEPNPAPDAEPVSPSGATESVAACEATPDAATTAGTGAREDDSAQGS